MTNLEKLRAGYGLRMPPSDSWGKPARDDYEAALALMRQAADEIEELRRRLKRVGDSLIEQDERWGLYGNECQDALVEFKAWRNGQP